ncbi:MAG: oxaloacetate decarboxylase [Betaproteobacteria bacterium]|nr:oxaloacetate decarboxylase [Betaproteobacteria bacterium]
MYSEQRQFIRSVLAGDRCLSPATVYDALSARVAESVGFRLGILAGSVCAGTVLAAPDVVVQTLTEFADQVRRVMRYSKLSLMVDADTGYGNALNVMRTVEELEHAGVALLTIEDLIMPQRFGAASEFELVSTEEMCGKLRAALAARRDPALVIAARTAGLKGEDTARTVARARAYAATGVDALFITGLKKLSDFDAVRAAVKLPIIVGTAPEIKREDLAARGVRVLLQSHPPVRAVAKALREVYAHLYAGGAPGDLKPKLATPQEMEELLGGAQYAEWMRAYLQ